MSSRPPFVRGNANSETASDFIKPKRISMAQRIFDHLQVEGRTCAEVEADLGFKHQTASARFKVEADEVVGHFRERFAASGKGLHALVASGGVAKYLSDVQREVSVYDARGVLAEGEVLGLAEPEYVGRIVTAEQQVAMAILLSGTLVARVARVSWCFTAV